MISPLLVGAALEIANMGFASIIGQFQSARNNHYLIKSNEEMGRKAGLNQMKIAVMQIQNLQEIEQRKRETHLIIASKQIQAAAEQSDLKFTRDKMLKELELQVAIMMQQLDHEQQMELEKFRRQEKFAFVQWRTEKEREFRLETAELNGKIRKQIAEDNRKHVEKLIGLKILHQKSWPLRNPSLVYLELNSPKLLVFLAPPVITPEESQAIGFPQLDAYLSRMLQEFVMPFYANRLDIDGGSWLSKSFQGNSTLKPLVLELSSRSFLVIDSSLTGLPFGKELINLSVAYKGAGQEETHFVNIVGDLNYHDMAGDDWQAFRQLWAFLHCFYVGIYTDLHFFQLGELQVFHFVSVLSRLLNHETFRPLLITAGGKLDATAERFITAAIEHIQVAVAQLYFLQANAHELLRRLSADVEQLHEELAPVAQQVLQFSFQVWCAAKVIGIEDFQKDPLNEQFLAKLSDADLFYLKSLLEHSPPLPKDALPLEQIQGLLHIFKDTRKLNF